MAFKLASVGGERQFVQVACLQMPPKAAHQIVDTAPDERLAPCQPQATDAPSYEGGGDAVDLLQAQHLGARSEEHTSELQSLMRISYAVFCLKKKNTQTNITLSPSQHIIKPNT